MHEADCNVLCVPQQHALARIAAAPRVVVIPTDFSVLADRAIRYGYAPLAYGATVHLVHVASDIQDAERARLRDQLEARVPAGADARGIATEVHIVEGSSVWLAIWQHASRAGAELICMSTHSRDAVGSLVLGSQAQALLQHSRVPVLLIPPDRES